MVSPNYALSNYLVQKIFKGGKFYALLIFNNTNLTQSKSSCSFKNIVHL